MPKLKFLLYAGGIGLSYWAFGVVQEEISSKKHGPENEKFTCTLSLVLMQCIVNAIFAKLILMFIFKQGVDKTKSSYYGLCSLTYLVAMVSSNMALRHVNYPTQVIGKSCKPIPIMILGVLLSKKRYSIQKYLSVSSIVFGVALFMYKKEDISSMFSIKNYTATDFSIEHLLSSLGIGELLLILSLTMDGLTGAVQERMKNEHQTKSGHMMYKMNLWSVGYLLIATLVTGDLLKFYQFLNKYPTTIYDVVLFSSLSAIGQLFIFLTVAEFGPLPCSIVTTTRKFFTVLTSVFWFGHKLTSTQWIGSAVVFTGLFVDSLYSKSSPPVKDDKKKQKKVN